jgi:heme exporter protein D
MPASFTHWLAMGGYAAYVWPAYGVAVLVLGGLSLASIRAARAARRDLERLQRNQPRSRG